MLSRLLNQLNALFNVTPSLEELGEGAETRARRRLVKTPMTFLVGAVFAGVLLLMLGLPVQAQEETTTETSDSEETKENYKYRDGDPDGEVIPEGASDPENVAGMASEGNSGIDEDPEGNPYVAGELLVAYKEDTSQAAQDEVDQRTDAKMLDKFPKLDSRLLSFPEIKNEQSKEAREQALEQKKQELEQDPKVEAVGYNYLRWAAQEPKKESTQEAKPQEVKPGATPNDPFFGVQWGHSRISAPQAWDVATGNGALISVLDTGIDAGHPDIGGKLDFQFDPCNNDNTADEENGHGTHVAGIATASSFNGTGIAGTAPNARLQAAKVLCGPQGGGTDGTIVAGIDWSLLAPRAHVINMSIQGCGYSGAQDAAVNRAWASGALTVAIAGNWFEQAPPGCGGPNPTVYPGAYNAAMSVAAININDTRSNFSGVQNYVDVAAPGGNTNPYVLNQNILSTFPRHLQSNSGVNGYEWQQGTSQAAPMVSGVSALLASQGLNNLQIWQRIAGTAIDRGPAGYDGAYGHGLVNAYRAVTYTPPSNPPPPYTPPSYEPPSYTPPSYTPPDKHKKGKKGKKGKKR